MAGGHPEPLEPGPAAGARLAASRGRATITIMIITPSYYYSYECYHMITTAIVIRITIITIIIMTKRY